MAAPLGDFAMVTAEQDGGNFVVAPRGGLRVHRVLQQTVGVGLLNQGLRIADDPGKEASNGFHHGQHGYFAAVEDVVAKADRTNREVVLRPVDDPLIDTLVASAGKDKVLFLGKFVGQGLVEPLPAGEGTIKTGLEPSRVPETDSRACAHGSGFMTIPAPPP